MSLVERTLLMNRLATLLRGRTSNSKAKRILRGARQISSAVLRVRVQRAEETAARGAARFKGVTL